MKRRDFIYKTIIGAGGISLASVPLLTSCSLNGGGKHANISLIGCGRRGKQLLEYLPVEGANFTLKHVCDVDSRRGEEARAKASKLLGYAPEYVKDMAVVFEDKEVNTVIIATPGHWSALAAVSACQAGKDVYLEAMPGLSIGEGQKLLEVSQQNQSAVQVGFQHRSADYCISARDYIASGQLGQIVNIKTYNLMGGSARQSLADSSEPEGLDWNAWLGPAPSPRSPWRRPPRRSGK